MDKRIEDKGRVAYADALKVIAAFSVVFLHVAAGGWNTAVVGTLQWHAFNMYDSLVRFGVPVFVMVSGMFLLNPEKDLSCSDIYKKYIPKITVSFVSWSILYALYPVAVGGLQFERDKFARDFIFGHYHMWYLYMIVGLYMALPIIRRVTQDRKSTEYFMVLSVIFAFLMPFAAKLIQSEDFTTFIRKFDLNIVLGYSGYFVAGYYIGEYELKNKTRALFYVLGVLGVLATAYFTYLLSMNSGKPDALFYSYLSPNVMLASIGVFVFFRYEVSKICFGKNSLKVLNTLSECSFRIYLVHDFFNMILRDNGIDILSYNGFLSVPVIALLVFAFSFIASYIIGKTPVLNKIL